MSYSHYDFPGLWFQIYKQVLALNERQEDDRLDKSALREVVTSIFIASTQKGIVRPRPMTKFQSEMMTLLEPIVDRDKQEQIYKLIKGVV
jgi:hypothetical protein